MILRKMKVTEQLIIDYIDGALTKEQAQFVMEQLNADPALMDSYLFFKETDALFQSIPVLPPSSHFSKNVMSSIQAMQVKKYEPAKFGSVYLVPVAIMTLALLAFFMQTGSAVESGSSIAEYITFTLPDITIDIPLASNFKNYSYVLLIICTILLMDTFLRRKPVAISIL